MPSMKVLLDPSRTALRAHVCPECLGPMTLVLTTPALANWEYHTFIGVNCDHVDKVVVETGSKSERW